MSHPWFAPLSPFIGEKEGAPNVDRLLSSEEGRRECTLALASRTGHKQT